MSKITVEVPDGKTAVWKNGILTLVDANAKDNRPVTERVKNWDDVVRELGYDPVERLLDHTERGDGFDIEPDEIAYIKIKAIATVLNEGWKPEFVSGERRYFPWFVLYTKKEIEELDEDDRSRVVLRSGNYAYAVGGVAYAYASYDSSVASTNNGSRLAFKNYDLAVYAGKQFTKEFADFVFPERQNPRGDEK